MSNPIYKPKGAAAEYGEYALNIYTGCPHGCFYCFGPSVLRKKREVFHNNCEPRNNIVEETQKQLNKWEERGVKNRVIHLCFTCDPFPKGEDHTPTIEIIKAIKRSNNNVQILTKNYDFLNENPSLENILDENDYLGITYDGEVGLYDTEEECYDAATSVLHQIDYQTKCNSWVSFEPVVNDKNVLLFINNNSCFIGKTKIGKLNYHPSDINWHNFAKEIITLCKDLGMEYYIKESLKKYI